MSNGANMAVQMVESTFKWHQERMRVADATSFIQKQLEVQDYYIRLMHFVHWVIACKLRTSITMAQPAFQGLLSACSWNTSDMSERSLLLLDNNVIKIPVIKCGAHVAASTRCVHAVLQTWMHSLGCLLGTCCILCHVCSVGCLWVRTAMRCHVCRRCTRGWVRPHCY